MPRTSKPTTKKPRAKKITRRKGRPSLEAQLAKHRFEILDAIDEAVADVKEAIERQPRPGKLPQPQEDKERQRDQ
jgi:hypothetical protein